ncbi:hypothetical protein [Paenibacillus polymyxa]|uniref:hypothetical protein n=1 Tax=Paenibacillus polymyxa TaxID=1406 RepID=UPI002ED63DD9
MIITIALARDTDSGANLWQHVMVRIGRILESLVAVNDEASHAFCCLQAYRNVCKTSLLSFL